MKSPLLSIIIALSLCLCSTACASSGAQLPSDEVVRGSGVIEFTSKSEASGTLPQPESPPAVENSAASASSAQGTAPASSTAAASSAQSSPAQSSTQGDDKNSKDTQASTPTVAKPAADEVRSVWISYLELGNLLTGKSQDAYRSGITAVMDNCAEFGLNTVILQVRPFADAIYPSKHFPQSYLFTGDEGSVGEAPFDALQITIEEAHKRGLRLEAWINPYRIRNAGNRKLGSNNPASNMLQSGDAVQMGEVITYNPASTRAQQLIVDGVTELVANYDIDAIHFDDYFYPTTDAAFDADHYSQYKAGGGTQSLAAWRRSNVTTLVRKVNNAINSTNSSVLFGISPQGNMGNNLNMQYVDVEEIMKANLIDYICPQVYFGFQNAGCPYQSTVEEFNRMARGTNVDVYIGLATYKFNKTDTWAGAGKSEWIGTTDLIRRQVEAARELSQYGGFVLYRYDSTLSTAAFYSADSAAQKQATAEMASLKKIL